MSNQNTPRPNKRQPRTLNRRNPPTPDDTFNLGNPSPTLFRPYPNQPYQNQPYRNPVPSEQRGFQSFGMPTNTFSDYASQSPSWPFGHPDYHSQPQMGGSSSYPQNDPPRSPIHSFNLGDCYYPQFSESYQETVQETQQEEVATSPPKPKKRASRPRQTKVDKQSTSQQTAWTEEEGRALCKGWRSVSEDSVQGNTKRSEGMWTEILNYIESKTGQEGRGTYDMVFGKWKHVRPAVSRFAGIFSNVIRTTESGKADEDYVQKAMAIYHNEVGIPFRYRHCWDILKYNPKFQDVEPLDFSHPSQGSNKKQKSSGSSSLNTESVDVSFNLNTSVDDDDEVAEVPPPPTGRDKARASLKKKGKGSQASGSSTMNDEELVRLMVNEMTTAEIAQRDEYMQIKKSEVASLNYRAEQEDLKLYFQNYDHMTGSGRAAWELFRANLKAKYNWEF